jgi:hypothetical protein
MSNGEVDRQAAWNLNSAIMAMANQTPFHQREPKVVDLIAEYKPDSPTLAMATATLVFNSQTNYEATEQLRRTMKIMLDAQMLKEELAAAQYSADLMTKQISAQQQLTLIGEKQSAAAERMAILIVEQIETQKKLAAASDKQAKAANFLGRVNIGLAFIAAVLVAVQTVIAYAQSQPMTAISHSVQPSHDSAVGHSSAPPASGGVGHAATARPAVP